MAAFAAFLINVYMVGYFILNKIYLLFEGDNYQATRNNAALFFLANSNLIIAYENAFYVKTSDQ